MPETKPKLYRVLPGQSFQTVKDEKQVTIGAGEEIELADDVAAEHAHRVRLVTPADLPALAKGSALSPVIR